MLSPIDGRPIRTPDEASIRRCYRGENGTLKSPVRTMHRVQVGSLAYVGDQANARISITRGHLIHNPYIPGWRNAFKSLGDTLSKIHEATEETLGRYGKQKN